MSGKHLLKLNMQATPRNDMLSVVMYGPVVKVVP